MLSVKQLFQGLFALALIAGAVLPNTADARHHNYDHGYYGGRGYYNAPFSYNHPFVSKGLMGAGLGAATGAIISPDGYRGENALKGGAIGGAAGVGYQLFKQGVGGGRW